MSDAPQGFWSKLAQDPAIKQLASNVGEYATAKGKDMAKAKLPGPEEATGIIDAGKKEAKREAVVPAVKGFFKGAWSKLTGKAKGGKGKRPINVLETALVAAPVEMVWEAWRDFEQWPNFMKGPESVKVDDDGQTTSWTAKVFIHRRQWKSTITEEVEYERLRWKSEAAKGQVDGMVAFSPAGENLTFCVLVLEYRPKGFFEQIGKTWRVQGRRARLDFKHFQRHVAMADQADALAENGEQDQDERPDDAAGPAPGAEPAGDTSGTEPAAEPGTAEGAADAGAAGAGQGGAGADQVQPQR